jgi:PAS domain S-box-containing protein
VRVSVLEQSLFQCAAQMFLDERGARQCRAAIRRLLGDALYGQLCSFLSYLRTCHLWTEAHPELSYEQDGRVVEHLHELLREEPRLEEFFSHYRRRRWNPREKRLLAELAKHDQVEQSLRENELRFHHAVRHAPFPIMIYAEDGQVLEVNRAWSEMSGYTLADTPTVATWLGKAQQGKGRWLREDIASLDGWDGIVEEGEYAIKTKVGTTRIWEFSSTILGRLADGRRTVMRAAVDLTERKDLEAALWQTNRTIINLLEAITDGFAALDGQWRFLYLNQQVERLMQHPREELVGRPIWEVLPSFADTEMGIAARRAAADGVVVHGETYYGPTERWLEYHFYPAAEGLSLYLRDVTARHGYEGEAGGRPEAGGGVDWGTTCMLGEGI